MCTGRVDPTFIMKALAGGMDGVIVCGCHFGDCHYINGNCKMKGRFILLRKLLLDLGVEKERVRLEWISAAESERYAQVMRDMTEDIRALGPLNWPTLDE
jgi:F420-non-reducing hydrogenase iron-sulfur subunit